MSHETTGVDFRIGAAQVGENFELLKQPYLKLIVTVFDSV